MHLLSELYKVLIKSEIATVTWWGLLTVCASRVGAFSRGGGFREGPFRRFMVFSDRHCL